MKLLRKCVSLICLSDCLSNVVFLQIGLPRDRHRIPLLCYLQPFRMLAASYTLMPCIHSSICSCWNQFTRYTVRLRTHRKLLTLNRSCQCRRANIRSRCSRMCQSNSIDRPSQLVLFSPSLMNQKLARYSLIHSMPFFLATSLSRDITCLIPKFTHMPQIPLRVIISE